MTAAAGRTGRGALIWRAGPLSLRLPRRTLVVRGVLTLLALALAVTGIVTGSHPLPLDELGQAILGEGRDGIVRMVWEWRLPRVLFALVEGVALAVSGAIFQSITRNPLGSPDVIGFDAGAYTGVLVVTLGIGSTSYALTAAGALGGGLGAAALVALLAWRRGMQGLRLVIVGIGAAAFLTAVNNYLLIRSGAQQAQAATSWGFGSFASLGYAQLAPLAVAVAVLLCLVAARATAFSQLELGGDAAAALGVRVERSRLAMTALGVALTAVATAASGPIAFVALVAPQLAGRLTRARGLDLPTAALTGATLLLAADLAGQRVDLSVGLVTVILGGGYFLWLIIREGRRR